jgi:hypothetical protein
MAYNGYIYDCECISGLRWNELTEAKLNIARKQVLIPERKNLIVIISEYDRAYIGLNGRGLSLYRGINCFCICGLQNVRETVPLYLSPHILSNLVEIENRIGEHCMSFALKRSGHRVSCTQKTVQSLSELAFERMFLNYPMESQFRAIFREGHLPFVLRDLKPSVRLISIFAEKNSFLGVYFQQHMISTSICDKEEDHMEGLWY